MSHTSNFSFNCHQSTSFANFTANPYSFQLKSVHRECFWEFKPTLYELIDYFNEKLSYFLFSANCFNRFNRFGVTPITNLLVFVFFSIYNFSSQISFPICFASGSIIWYYLLNVTQMVFLKIKILTLSLFVL